MAGWTGGKELGQHLFWPLSKYYLTNQTETFEIDEKNLVIKIQFYKIFTGLVKPYGFIFKTLTIKYNVSEYSSFFIIEYFYIMDKNYIVLKRNEEYHSGKDLGSELRQNWESWLCY